MVKANVGSIEAITAVNGNSSVQDAPSPPHPTTSTLVTDTVFLSDTAQATLLQEKGKSLAEIGLALGLSITEVSKDLGLNPPKHLLAANISTNDPRHV